MCKRHFVFTYNKSVKSSKLKFAARSQNILQSRLVSLHIYFQINFRAIIRPDKEIKMSIAYLEKNDHVMERDLRRPRSRTWDQFGPVGHCERLSMRQGAGQARDLTFTDLTQHTIIRRVLRETARSLTIVHEAGAAQN